MNDQRSFELSLTWIRVSYWRAISVVFAFGAALFAWIAILSGLLLGGESLLGYEFRRGVALAIALIASFAVSCWIGVKTWAGFRPRRLAAASPVQITMTQLLHEVRELINLAAYGAAYSISALIGLTVLVGGLYLSYLLFTTITTPLAILLGAIIIAFAIFLGMASF